MVSCAAPASPVDTNLFSVSMTSSCRPAPPSFFAMSRTCSGHSRQGKGGTSLSMMLHTPWLKQ